MDGPRDDAPIEPPDRRERVRAAIVAAGGERVSGESLARALGCSRAAIHRHVEALRREGLPVATGPGGYRLEGDADPVVPSLVQPRLAPPLAGPVRWHPSIGSTNDEATRLARAGAEEGLVVGADHQSAGRGRRGRPWVDRPGDALMFSLLLRPPLAPVDAGILPLLVAVGLADALGRATDAPVEIAWPNDVLMGGRKVAGILLELSADQERIAWAVAGIGVNVRSAPDIPDARWPPGALADAGAARPRGDLLVAVLTAVSARYRSLLADGPGAVLDAYASRDHLAGRRVTLSLDGEDVRGVASGIDVLGRLRLATEGGERRLAAGEVVRVGAAPGGR
jgi:BirA family transcriptional regulator, biotin operon repressor / biotin---[acetyl-CoA-carboxylase] ligase